MLHLCISVAFQITSPLKVKLLPKLKSSELFMNSWMDGDHPLQISHTRFQCALYSQSLESLERRNRGPGHFLIKAGEQKLYKEMKWAEVVREAQGLYCVQTLPERLAEQCEYISITAWGRSRLDLQSSSTDPQVASLAKTQAYKSKLSQRTLEERLEEKITLFLEWSGHPQLGVIWTGHFARFQTRQHPDLLWANFCSVYGWFLQWLWFCKAALLPLWWDHRL